MLLFCELSRFDVEVGGWVSAQLGIANFYDHMSHKHILPGENKGIDHIGVRFHLRFEWR